MTHMHKRRKLGVSSSEDRDSAEGDVSETHRTQNGSVPPQPTIHSLPFSTRELSITLPGQLLTPVRILECRDSQEFDEVFYQSGEEDSTGARIWPLAYTCASEILRLGVVGRSVLELGCGCGLVSVVARHAGAEIVLATDRNLPNLQLVSASMELADVPGRFAAELFDVSLENFACIVPLVGAPRLLDALNIRNELSHRLSFVFAEIV